MEKLEPRKCVEDILERRLEFFDYQKMDKGSWQSYFNDAKLIAENETFLNELNHYIADLVKFCATMDGSSLSTDRLIKLTNVQFGIVVLETFRDRLEKIEDPRSNKTNDEPYEPI